MMPASFNRLSGGLAQLVERLLCTEKVSGSTPLASRYLDRCYRPKFVLGVLREKCEACHKQAHMQRPNPFEKLMNSRKA
jgi:hypothetical protein